MKKRLEDYLPEVPKEVLKKPLSTDMESKALSPEDEVLLKQIQDKMKDRKNVSGSATQ